MDINFYLIGGVGIVVGLIIFNHKVQKDKTEKFLRKSAGTQPIFLQKSVEIKISTLTNLLYNDNNDQIATSGKNNEEKQLLIRVFEKLQTNFVDKKIPLRTYDEQLAAVLKRANKLYQAI